jgi:hypothetical protein
MSRTLKRLTALCLTLFLGLVMAGAMGSPASAQTNAGPNFSDAKLNAFIDAAKKIDGLIATWNPKIAAAKTTEEKQKLMVQANSEATKVVENTKGISVEEYAQIGAAAQQDPQLAARLDKIYQSR